MAGSGKGPRVWSQADPVELPDPETMRLAEEGYQQWKADLDAAIAAGDTVRVNELYEEGA